MAETTAEAPATKARPSRQEARCSVEGCKRPYRAKSYCVTHYKAWRRGELQGHRARYKTCTKEGCRKPRFKGSLCEEHAKAKGAES
jgi:hypothetical protein